jgi:hypothetical protein
MAIQMTKAQYEAKYGATPTSTAPVKMTQAEYDAKYKPSLPVNKKEGYFSRVAGEYTKAGQDIVSGINKSAEEVQKGLNQGGIGGALNVAKGLGRSALRTVGGVAGATFAPITEAPIVKPALEAVSTGISKIPGVETIVQKATELAKKHPESAKDLEDIINIATIAGGSSLQKPMGATLEKTGVALEKSGLKSADIAKKSFAKELIMPVETKAVKLGQVKRTSEASGFFKKDIVNPTQTETKMAEEISKISGISEKNTYQKNYNLVKDYNVSQAEKLENDVAKNNFAISKEITISKLDESAKSLSESPLITGDAETMANKLINGAKKFVESNEANGSGLLKARKEYDNWVLSQKPKAFDAKAENAFTIANRSIRDTINTVLDENAVNLGVKESLRSQSTLYRAMENIAPKAAEEANTPIARAFQRMANAVGLKNKIVQQVAAIAGIGGLGAAATFAPGAVVVGGGGFLVYRAGKLVMSPEMRIALGQLLQKAGNLINPADKNIIQKAIIQYGESE